MKIIKVVGELGEGYELKLEVRKFSICNTSPQIF